MELVRATGVVAQLLEAVGVAIMPIGALVAVVRLWRGAGAYRGYRQDLGRAILLGLEFLVAADIIRTVSTRPTLRSVVVLALVVLVRTFLSMTLEVELDGRWPWQRRGAP